ncbi:MAG TPA: hypothetical protein EYN73_07235 [Chromatiaceae bacterium]|nr:hypothetical protein [Chromatiaceae bacterium]HIA08844.1 hypothetical protein [Chromatiaceae bacterium]HIN82385.1 hypothetical protein [Chromatiales bacterium]HIO53794.1 hypothetical protein [Chromatiales bacterium]
MKLPLWRCAGAGLSANGIRPMGVMLATLLIQLSTPVFAQTECLEFRDPEVMLSTTDRWRVFVAERDVNRILDWIVGVTPPPKVVRREVVQQTRCLLNALSHSDVPLTEVPQVYSGRRSFTRQQSIWMRKYNFSGGAFDRISETARNLCGDGLPAESARWQPHMASHRQCWLGEGGVGRSLDSNQRQRETLQATAMPGLSRHHWATDIDILDPYLNPASWENAGPYVGAYRWLRQHAGSHGFVQPYRHSQVNPWFIRIEEGWHWSYYPVASVLQAFARQHPQALAKRLAELWGDNESYSFVRDGIGVTAVLAKD